MNILLKIFLSLLIIFPTISDFFTYSPLAATTLSPGTYTIKNILAHDPLQHPGPKTVAEILEYVDSGGEMPGRTGWSAYDLKCVNGKFEKDKTVFTSDSGRDKRYPPSEYQSEILASLQNDGYSASEAQAIFQAAVDSGLSLVYQEGTKVSIYSSGEKKWHPCQPHERGAYYNNLDFQLTLTFEIKEGGTTPDPPTEPDPPSCEETGDCPPPEPPPPIDVPGNDASPSCSFDIIYQGSGGNISDGLNPPNPSGEITSDSKEFDVIQGIPSSEYLKTTARSEEYIYGLNFENNTGIVEYTITATKTFHLNWFEGEQEYNMTTTESETVTVTRDWAYWEIITYWLSELEGATMTNYALPNGSVTFPSGVNVNATATTDKMQDNHVFPADCPIVVLPSESLNVSSPPGFYDEALSEAEAATGLTYVKNDSATLNGSVIMDDSLTQTSGPRPKPVPAPKIVEFEKGNLLIDPKKTNYFEAPSIGVIHYKPVVNINGENLGDFPFDVNHVTVHTPTVIYAKASDDKEHDQRTNPPNRATPANPDVDRHAFILDRPFYVDMPTNGQHRDIPGYGDRDYAKYIKQKQVKFPFDVYTETKAGYYPANTWIDIPVDLERAHFFMPVWVPEGKYTVDFRSFAINALEDGDFGGTEHHGNVTIPNPEYNVPPAGEDSAAHVAIDSIEVDVVGRLYDLRITDVTDYNWRNTFRQSDGVTPTGNSFWVGSNGIDGDNRGLDEKFKLPVRHGSTIENYSNVAIKTGYKFRFDLKTKGNMQNGNDAIRIKPTFYFVNSDGTNRQQVDLYYKDAADQFIRVGSSNDVVNREVVLNETLRNVPINELIANADYYYRHAAEFDGMTTAIENKFPTTFARDYIKLQAKEKVVTGPYGWQILNWKLRTYRGPEENEVPTQTMIPKEDIVGTEQTWYGEYSIPAESYAVPKGTNLAKVGLNGKFSDNSPIFLRDGYIIVNFDIETIDNGDLDNPYLQYINAPLMNQWFDMEGFARSFKDNYGFTFTSLDGDMVYYHGDADSMSDFDSSVTH